MRNVLKTAIAGVLAAAFVASVAVTQAQGPGPQGQGRGLDGPGRPGGPGGRGLVPGIMQDMTEEQRAKIKAIMDEQRGAGQRRPADAKLRQELEAELLADVPNDQKIDDLKQQILAVQADGLSRHIAVQKRVAQVLTAEQRAKARERIAKGPQEGRGKRGN